MKQRMHQFMRFIDDIQRFIDDIQQTQALERMNEAILDVQMTYKLLARDATNIKYLDKFIKCVEEVRAAIKEILSTKALDNANNDNAASRGNIIKDDPISTAIYATRFLTEKAGSLFKKRRLKKEVKKKVLVNAEIMAFTVCRAIREAISQKNKAGLRQQFINATKITNSLFSFYRKLVHVLGKRVV